MTVLITFCAPPRQNSIDGLPVEDSVVHQRRLEGVPSQIAGQMNDDYRRYKSNGTRVGRYKVYRFEQAGEEVKVALDFREITDLDISRA